MKTVNLHILIANCAEEFSKEIKKKNMLKIFALKLKLNVICATSKCSERVYLNIYICIAQKEKQTVRIVTKKCLENMRKLTLTNALRK